MTRRAGLIGYPVDHSLSPVIQQAAFDALHLDARYELWPTPADEVLERIASLREPDVIGANVTVPHKQRAFELVDNVSDLARRVGAVNTIITSGDRLTGDNTDVAGFLHPLQSREYPLSRMRAVVLGAGGAARGVLVGLLLAGCPSIVVANRTAERADDLARELGEPVSAVGLGEDLRGSPARGQRVGQRHLGRLARQRAPARSRPARLAVADCPRLRLDLPFDTVPPLCGCSRQHHVGRAGDAGGSGG